MNIVTIQPQPIQGYRLILGYLGMLCMLIGGITLLPLLTLFFYPQDGKEAIYFLLPGMIAILVGFLFYQLIRGKEKGRLARNQDAVIVVSCWLLAIIITAFPFMLSGHYDFTRAVFETTSGWSTTGLSVVDVTHTSHLFLMHRSTILFFGGVGLVVIMLSVLSDTYGMRLYNAEGHSDRLLPNVIKSARIILIIYFCYISAGVVLYVICGMPIFDAIIHSIGALSTGGFSNQADSIAHYHSISIEIITMVLMILGNINFLAHLFLLRGKFRNFFYYCEIRFQFILIAFAIPIIAFLLVNNLQYLFGDSFRLAAFQVISALTTTGFQTMSSFQGLPASFMLIMIILQLIGGGIGSTAGGIKQYRVYVMVKHVIWHLRSLFHSQKMLYTHKIYKVESKEKIESAEILSCSTYIFMYLVIFLLGSLLLSLFGFSLQDAMFEFSSALSTVGLSTGIMNYHAADAILWIGTFGMFVGRLEIYVVIMALLRLRKDGHHYLHTLKKA